MPGFFACSYCSYCWCWWCLAGAINCVSVCLCGLQWIYLFIAWISKHSASFMLCRFNVFVCVLCVCVCVPFGSLFAMCHIIFYTTTHTHNHFVHLLVNCLEQVDALHISLFLILSVVFPFASFASSFQHTHIFMTMTVINLHIWILQDTFKWQ